MAPWSTHHGHISSKCYVLMFGQWSFNHFILQWQALPVSIHDYAETFCMSHLGTRYKFYYYWALHHFLSNSKMKLSAYLTPSVHCVFMCFISDFHIPPKLLVCGGTNKRKDRSLCDCITAIYSTATILSRGDSLCFRRIPKKVTINDPVKWFLDSNISAYILLPFNQI